MGGEGDFLDVLRDLRARKARFPCQQRLQVPKTSLDESPCVSQMHPYRARFQTRESFRELLVLCFEICELGAERTRESHAGDRFRAVASLALDQFDAPA